MPIKLIINCTYHMMYVSTISAENLFTKTLGGKFQDGRWLCHMTTYFSRHSVYQKAWSWYDCFSVQVTVSDFHDCWGVSCQSETNLWMSEKRRRPLTAQTLEDSPHLKGKIKYDTIENNTCINLIYVTTSQPLYIYFYEWIPSIWNNLTTKCRKVSCL